MEWAELAEIPAEERQIDIWWRESETGELMLLLAYLMTRHDVWVNAKIRVLAPRQSGNSDESHIEALTAFLEQVRIEAEPVIIETDDMESVIRESAETPLVFMPFAIHGRRFYHPFGGEVADLLPKLQIVVMALAAQDVDLEADPDELAEGEAQKLEEKPA